jgi:hypothetical protein
VSDFIEASLGRLEKTNQLNPNVAADSADGKKEVKTTAAAALATATTAAALAAISIEEQKQPNEIS